MSLVESTTVPLGSPLPEIILKDPQGQSHTDITLMGKKGLLIAFTCNHCPYAIAVWPRLVALANLAKKHGINTAAINPNIHPDYPQDGPDEMIKKTKEWNISFPYLIDSSQGVSRSFDAQCTPDLYLFNHDGKLIYHGRIDDNWQDEKKVTKHELKTAILNLSETRPIDPIQFPSMGCSIKWK
jgi:peroxiredoxin